MSKAPSTHDAKSENAKVSRPSKPMPSKGAVGGPEPAADLRPGRASDGGAER